MSDAPVEQAAELKVTLVISGAIALGSFESGVIRELARAARAAGGPFTIDLIAGTSAGSITGAQVAKVMTAPVPDFRPFALWGDVTMDKLTSGYTSGETSPFSHTWMSAQLAEQLGGGAEPDDEDTAEPTSRRQEPGAMADSQSYKWAPPQPVRLLVTLTDLEGDVRPASYGDGINVPVEGCYNGVSVITRLDSKTSTDEWTRVAKLVLASSAHPAAWEAVQVSLPGPKDNRERWEPGEKFESLLRRRARTGKDLYFSDGGSVDNLPVGKALRLQSRDEKGNPVPQRPYDPHRIVVYVEPDPVTVSARKGEYHRWSRHALQGAQIAASGSIPLGDLRWVGETNEAVVQLLEFVAAYDPAVRVPSETAGKILPFLKQQGVAAWPELETLIKGLEEETDPNIMVPNIQVLAQPLGDASWKGRIPEPNPKAEERAAKKHADRDKCVEALYKWLDDFAGLPDASIDVDQVMNRLVDYLDRAPTGSRPACGGDLCRVPGKGAETVTDRIRRASINLAYRYYSQKTRAARARLIEYHKQAARLSPAGDRQWAFVTRIVPGEEKPLSRSLGHFGGFLKPEWMQYDYVLGRRCAIRWLRAKFPENEYVKGVRLPDLPEIESDLGIGPALVAQNLSAIAAVARQVKGALIEELPWLRHRVVTFLLRTMGVYTATVVIWSLGIGLQLVAKQFGAEGVIKSVADAITARLGSSLFGGFSLSALLGFAYSWWNSRRPMEPHIIVVVVLWTAARVGGEVGRMVKALVRRRPETTSV